MTKRITRTRPERQEGNISGSVRVIERGVNASNQTTEYDRVSELLASSAHGNMIIDPPYPVDVLFHLIDVSSMLPQCITAMVTNTVGAGWEVAPIRKNDTIDESEKEELESFIEHANSEESMSAVIAKAKKDRYSVGFGFVEVIRDRKGDVSLLRHAPSLTMRLTAKHKDPQLIKYDIARGKRTSTIQEFKRFRKYVQVINGTMTWFKEFGDPRAMDSRTGLFEGDSGYEADIAYAATEIIHIRNQSNDPYGVPEWISLVPGIKGAREAEEVNMRFFEDNMIPPVLLTVAGGRLTASSFQEIKRILNKDPGKKRMNQMVLLEAVSDSDAMDKANSVQIKVDKLASERPSDGLFKEYKEGNQADLRSAFRLPPVAVGMSQDANFATANVSQFVAETQVFGPERNKTDEELNNLLVNGRNGLRLRTCKLVARTPTITSPEMVMKALTALNVIGAVTPRAAQKIANSMLQIELPPYPEKGQDGWEEWMDKPMPITVKETAGNNHDTPPSNTHDEQSLKDPATKALEGSGDVSQKPPEHGQE